MKDLNLHFVSLSEEKQEKHELEMWSNPLDIPEIDIEQMETLLEHPPKLCDDQDHCNSYRLSGDRCKCIRTLFLHETHYELYKQLVKQKIEQGFWELISKPGKHLDKDENK